MIEQLIAEATECDFKVALEIKKPKSWLKSVNTKMTGAVTIISRHFKIFIPVPPSNAPDAVCTGHPLLSHHLPSLPVFLW